MMTLDKSVDALRRVRGNGHDFGTWAKSETRRWHSVVMCSHCGTFAELTTDREKLGPDGQGAVGDDGRLYLREGARTGSLSESVLPACTGRYDAERAKAWKEMLEA